MYNKKRICDVIFSSLALIGMSPFMVLISIFILLSDGWPFIFTQKRIGYNGKIFVIYKFKTLRTQFTNKDTSHLESKDDYRIFFFGRILRSTHMDELPQFFNVLKNDMSIIGPRPLLYGQRAKTLEVLPGITGLAKVKMKGNDKSLEISAVESKYDDFYIKNKSFLFDLYIAVKTIPVIIKSGGI